MAAEEEASFSSSDQSSEESVEAPSVLSKTAKRNFPRTLMIELPLNNTNVITAIKEIDAQWLDGECNGRRGRFPRFVIEELAVVEHEARQGNSAAQCELGSRFFFGSGGAAKNDSEAYSWFKLSAAQGNVLAIAAIADCYSHGHGVKEDKGEAFVTWKKLADNGNIRVLERLGVSYYFGWGTQKDEQLGMATLQKAAENGNVAAQIRLFTLYEFGTYKNFALAFKTAKDASEKGIPEFFAFLAQCYESGLGTAIDLRQAFVWYRKDAEEGSSYGQRTVAEFYQKGNRFLKADKAEAIAWYTKAAALGDEKAQKALKLLGVT